MWDNGVVSGFGFLSVFVCGDSNSSNVVWFFSPVCTLNESMRPGSDRAVNYAKEDVDT